MSKNSRSDLFPAAMSWVVSALSEKFPRLRHGMVNLLFDLSSTTWLGASLTAMIALVMGLNDPKGFETNGNSEASTDSFCASLGRRIEMMKRIKKSTMANRLPLFVPLSGTALFQAMVLYC